MSYERKKRIDVNFCIRVTQQDKDAIQRLADLWGCSKAEATRTAIRMAEAQIIKARE